MKRTGWTVLLLAALCLLLILPGAAAETRQGVIFLEGMEEPVEETLFVSPQGFSFWYVNDRLEARSDAESPGGVYVGSLYSDDRMILSAIPEEEAAEYARDSGRNIVELAAGSRVQMDVYHVLENGRYRFLTLIGENGRYCCAIGDYAQEAAEGNARFLQRVLDSVAFGTGGPALSDARSILIGGVRYTLGESSIRDFERGGWAWTKDADGRFRFEVTEDGNEFYARTDDGQPDGRLMMVDLFCAYEIAYEYLGFGFDLAYDPEAEDDIYRCLEEDYSADYTDDGVLCARIRVPDGALLVEVGEGALRLTLE